MLSVSIQIATYNMRHLVADAIESILNQTYQDFELIVIDDGSADGTYDFIKENYGDNLTLLRHENHGLSYTRNVGIRHSQGRFIAFLDADDIWKPTYLEKMVGFLESSPDTVGMVYSAAEIDNGPDQPRWTHHPVYRGNCLYEHLTSKLMVSPSRVVLRSEVFNKTGLFDVSLKRSEDTDLWIRVAFHYDAECIEEPLVTKRFHGSNLMCNPDHFLQGIRILDKVFRDSSCPAHVRKWRREAYANRYMTSFLAYEKLNHLRGAMRSLFGVLRWHPESIRPRHLKKVTKILLRNVRKDTPKPS